MDAALDWRLAGPDLVRLPFLGSGWLKKVLVVPAPANDLDGPCWLYQGGLNTNGYGVVRDPLTMKLWLLHRFIFTNVKGVIKPGYDVHHLCRRRSCFQFGHLEEQPSLMNRIPGFLTDVALSAEDLSALCDSSWLKSNRPVCC